MKKISLIVPLLLFGLPTQADGRWVKTYVVEKLLSIGHVYGNALESQKRLEYLKAEVVIERGPLFNENEIFKTKPAHKLRKNIEYVFNNGFGSYYYTKDVQLWLIDWCYVMRDNLRKFDQQNNPDEVEDQIFKTGTFIQALPHILNCWNKGGIGLIEWAIAAKKRKSMKNESKLNRVEGEPQMLSTSSPAPSTSALESSDSKKTD